MVRFRGFTQGSQAIFLIDGQEKAIAQDELRRRRTELIRGHVRKGTCPEAEEYKFALERWPGTKLHSAITKKK